MDENWGSTRNTTSPVVMQAESKDRLSVILQKKLGINIKVF